MVLNGEVLDVSDIDQNKELCERYPFLIPRNVWTDKIPEDYDYSYTRLDDLEPGWRIAFGEQLCEELKSALEKADWVDAFRFTQIKEKWGKLCLYHFACNPSAIDVIRKYEKLSQYICGHCGKPATKVSTGWIYPYCDSCSDKLTKYEYFADIDEFYK